MTDTYVHDAFLRYEKESKEDAERLARTLRSEQVRVWYDEWEIKPGENVEERIAQGVRSSANLILCVSSKKTQSDWDTLEQTIAPFRDSKDPNRRLFVVKLADRDLPLALSH